MNIEQKEYIEQNIALLDGKHWDRFFLKAPDGIGGVLYKAGINFMSHIMKVPESCFEFSNIDSIIIPEGVTRIESYAFLGCKNLTSISIPDSVKSISVSAFSGCSSLKSITIPKGVTYLNATFHRCSSLTSVTIPDSVTFLGNCVFEDCSSLMNITIPESVTEIDYRAFQNCSSLTSITIPSSVTSIGEYVFDECLSLKTINFTGTSEQWRQIRKYKNTFTNVPTRNVICSDGVTNLRG